eukprot:14704583-Heterocapsa_arctica.AAC.1
MRAERQYIAPFGAARMTKEEALEMINNCVRYQNFWAHVTGYEEDEDRGGTKLKMGYCFYRDYGNEIYGDFLRTATSKGYEEGHITKTEFDRIN